MKQAISKRSLLLTLAFLSISCYIIAHIYFLRIYLAYVFFSLGIILIISTTTRWELKKPLQDSLLLFPLFAILIASTGWSLDFSRSLNGAILLVTQYAQFLLFSIAAYNVPWKAVDKNRDALLYLTLAIAIYYIVKYGTMRVGGISDVAVVSNEINAFLLFLVPFYVSNFFLGQRCNAFSYCALSAIGAGIILTGSRTGLLAFMPIILLSFVYIPWSLLKAAKKIMRSLLLLALLLAVAFGSLLSTTPQIRDSLSSTTERLAHTIERDFLLIDQQAVFSEGSNRAKQYYALFDAVSENWAFGIGFRAFKTYMAEEYSLGIVPHALLFEVLIGGGLLALLALLGIITKAYLRSSRRLSLTLLNRNEKIYRRTWVVALTIILMISLSRPMVVNPLLYITLAFVLARPSKTDAFEISMTKYWATRNPRRYV